MVIKNELCHETGSPSLRMGSGNYAIRAEVAMMGKPNQGITRRTAVKRNG